MEIKDIILLFKVVRNLDLNQGLVLTNSNQKIAILKREDKRGIYYSLSNKIKNEVLKVQHQEDPMMLILINQKIFEDKTFKSKKVIFK